MSKLSAINGRPDTRQILDAVIGANNNPLDYRGRAWLGFADVYLPVLQDTLVEGNEALSARLTLPALTATNGPLIYFGGAPIPVGIALGQSNAVIVIADDDFAYGTFAFSLANYVVTENVGSASITVFRTNGSVGSVTVRYSATAGTARPNITCWSATFT